MVYGGVGCLLVHSIFEARVLISSIDGIPGPHFYLFFVLRVPFSDWCVLGRTDAPDDYDLMLMVMGGKAGR